MQINQKKTKQNKKTYYPGKMECFHFLDKQMKDSSLISRQRQNIVIDTECMNVN